MASIDKYSELLEIYDDEEAISRFQPEDFRQEVVVDAKTGKLLWTFPHVYKGRMIALMTASCKAELMSSEVRARTMRSVSNFKESRVVVAIPTATARVSSPQ